MSVPEFETAWPFDFVPPEGSRVSVKDPSGNTIRGTVNTVEYRIDAGTVALEVLSR